MVCRDWKEMSFEKSVFRETNAEACLVTGVFDGLGQWRGYLARGRGICVMNKLLDYTPPPPPDSVPEIEPGVTGATTLREQLVKHRADATCAQCHNKIDPAGFALENFDAIGAWRKSTIGNWKSIHPENCPAAKLFIL